MIVIGIVVNSLIGVSATLFGKRYQMCLPQSVTKLIIEHHLETFHKNFKKLIKRLFYFPYINS